MNARMSTFARERMETGRLVRELLKIPGLLNSKGSGNGLEVVWCELLREDGEPDLVTGYWMWRVTERIE